MSLHEVLRNVADNPYAVQLHNYSAKTYVLDAIHEDMPEWMRSALKQGKRRIHEVWRCKVGQQRRWHFDWSLEGALTKAFHGGGHER
jgi:hypothetical protein